MSRINVLNQIMGVFQRKKPPCDDIVTAADKVIENYILSRSAFIRKNYTSGSQMIPALIVLSLFVAVASAILIIL